MNSSRNPKVLNHTLREKLNPLLKRVTALTEQDTAMRSFITETLASASTNKESVNAQVDAYDTASDSLTDAISTDNTLLSELITKQLLNPNVASSSDDDDDATNPEKTKVISDKRISAMAYGFVVNGSNIALVGAVNHGLGIGADPAIAAEFTFKTPDDSTFPSFYVNDIIRLSTSEALIATNAGVVDYHLATGTYELRDTSYGLQSNIITRIVQVKTSDGSLSGFIAGTDQGLAYSPNGIRWVLINEEFDSEIVCFSKTETPAVKQTKLLIGTPKGIYYLDVDKYLLDGDNTIHYLDSVTADLPSWYIYTLGVNTSKDELYIGTDSGISVIANITAYLDALAFTQSPASMLTYSVSAGLAGSICTDVLLTTTGKIIIATNNGITITSDFKSFTILTKKQSDTVSTTALLTSSMCMGLYRKDNTNYTVTHPIGLSEGISMSL